MSRDYPDWIDALKAAQGRRRFAGSVAVARLDRLHALIADPDQGELGFAVSFGLDAHGNVCADLAVFGELALICQRSLVPYQQAINSRSTLAIVTDERAVEALPEDYEPLLADQGRVRIEDLVAEEVLLSLPLVPHAPDSSPMGDDLGSRPGRAMDTHKPFADLADLAAKRKKNLR
ncbi:MAG: YceD family protein [Wenzhouxiangella sp.]